MVRQNTNSPHSIPLSFPAQLPPLRPPRSAKRKSNVDISGTTTIPSPPGPEVKAPVRNHRRSSNIELPDVENPGTPPSVWFRRKTSAIHLPFSPRGMNIELSKPVPRCCLDAPAIASKVNSRRNKSQKRLEMNDAVYTRPDYQTNFTPTDPSYLAKIHASPRCAALELFPEDDLPVHIVPPQGDDSQLSDGIPDRGELVYLGYDTEPVEDDFASHVEEMIVRAARSRAQHREQIARRWESVCSARIRLLVGQQAIQKLVLAEMSAAATCPPISHPTFFNVFGASISAPVVASSPPSPSESFGAPLARMSSPSPYVTCGETIDLAGMASVEHRNRLLGGVGSHDSRPLVERIIESMDDVGYDEICVDGLSETECRHLRAECRKRRKTDRQRAFDLGVLLELKRKQLGRSRSSSSSSSSSDSCSEPPTPPSSPLSVQSIDHLVAKMFLKRGEASRKPCTSLVATRAGFEVRSCSSLRRAVDINPPTTQTRGHSNSAKSTLSNLISRSGDVFGLGSQAWLREKERLTALDRD